MKRGKRQLGAKMVLPGWMASYADMFTVMMVFFVLLFAMSQIDDHLFQQFIASFNPDRQIMLDPMPFDGGGVLVDRGEGILPEPAPLDPVGAGDPYSVTSGYDTAGDTVGDMMNTFMTYMATGVGYDGTGVPSGVAVVEGEYYLRITFESDGLMFNSGQATLLPSAREALTSMGSVLRGFSDAGHGIIVEGHTDDQPIRTAQFPSNRYLSSARASAVTDFLVYNSGLSPRSIFPIGMSEYFYVGDNTTSEGRAQNRRVEIKVFTTGATGGAIGSWFVIPGTV